MEKTTREIEEVTQKAIGTHLLDSAASKEDALRALFDSLQQVGGCARADTTHEERVKRELGPPTHLSLSFFGAYVCLSSLGVRSRGFVCGF